MSFFDASTSQNQWLITTISLKNPKAVLLCEESKVTSHLCRKQNASIDKNVLPCQAYFATLLAVNVGDSFCQLSKRQFFTEAILNEDLSNQLSTIGLINQRRDRGEECKLAAQLRSMWLENTKAGDQETERLDYDLLSIHPTDLATVGIVASRSSGPVVEKVLWRCARFARKSFLLDEMGPHIFNREIQIAKKLSHPHVVYNFGWSVSGEKLYLLMELLNEDLRSFLTKSVSSCGDGPPLSLQESLNILLQIAHAMKYLHDKKVVHGDLKSNSILVSQFEMTGKFQYLLIKVADFGDAQVVDQPMSFKPFRGTTKYASPEVLAYHRNASTVVLDHPFSVDVYSFGIIAYEVLTGLEPYPGHSAKDLSLLVIRGTRPSLREECSKFQNHYGESLICLVEECWSDYPCSRPTFSEIRDKIKTILEGDFIEESRVVGRTHTLALLYLVEAIRDLCRAGRQDGKYISKFEAGFEEEDVIGERGSLMIMGDELKSAVESNMFFSVIISRAFPENLQVSMDSTALVACGFLSLKRRVSHNCRRSQNFLDRVYSLQMRCFDSQEPEEMII